MHDDLLGKFECCLTVKDMWDQLKIKLGQTYTTRLCTLHLKWIEYEFDPSQTITEHIRTLSGMVWDLKTTDQYVSEKEQVQNVIQDFLDTER